MPTLYVIREGYSIDDIDSDRVVAEGDILAISGRKRDGSDIAKSGGFSACPHFQ
jgi:hypothetical protein